MTWLVELLFDSIRTMCAQFVVDMMDMATGVFTDLLSCDLSLFEELFSAAGSLYRDAVLPMSVAFLIVICAWQLLKTMFGGIGTNAEEPVELAGRSMLCLFMVLYSRKLVDYLLDFAGTPYEWIVGSGIEIESFSGFVSAAELAAAALGIDTVSLQLLLLIMQLVVAWNYFKILYIVAERYVLLGVFSYTAPLAFATGGSKATNNILSNWAKVFGGQLVLIILDAWGLKMYLSAYGNLMASRHGFTRFFVGCLCLVGFCKIMQKLDSYLASLGVNLGRTSPGMSGAALAVMASRIVGRMSGNTGAGKAEDRGISQENTHRNAGKGENRDDRFYESSDFMDGNGPIPMPGGKSGQMQAEKTAGLQTGNEPGTYRQDNGVKMENSEGIHGNVPNRFADDGNRVGKNQKGSGNNQGRQNRGETSAGGKPEQDFEGTGIRSCGESDEELWTSLQEEAAAMDTAAGFMGGQPEEPSIKDGEGYDTGILSSPVSEEEDHRLTDMDGRLRDWKRNADNTEAGAAAGENEKFNGYAPAFAAGEIPGTGSDKVLPERGRTGETEEREETAGKIPEEAAGMNDHIPGISQEGSKEKDRKGQPAENPGKNTVADGQGGTVLRNGPGTGGFQNGDSAVPSRFAAGGRLYLSAEEYETPEIPYRMETRNGRLYYSVTGQAASGGIKATLQENGSIRYTREKGGWEPKKRQRETTAGEENAGMHGLTAGGEPMIPDAVCCGQAFL